MSGQGDGARELESRTWPRRPPAEPLEVFWPLSLLGRWLEKVGKRLGWDDERPSAPPAQSGTRLTAREQAEYEADQTRFEPLCLFASAAETGGRVELLVSDTTLAARERWTDQQVRYIDGRPRLRVIARGDATLPDDLARSMSAIFEARSNSVMEVSGGELRTHARFRGLDEDAMRGWFVAVFELARRI
ncbi:MAG TPA: hypothetical protein VG389_12665 [Myxococcota bacterium]|jgi:hypothetical protein|nr:hypothetical protein [Myxococcota bacterium]